MDKLASQSTTLDTLLTQGTAITIQLSEQDKEIGKLNKRLTVQHPREAKGQDASAHQTDETRLTYAGATATGDVEDSPETNAFLIGNSLIRKADAVKTAAGIPVETRVKPGATYGDLSKELDDVVSSFNFDVVSSRQISSLH